MKILIDMNLSPAWVSVLAEEGHIISPIKTRVRLAMFQLEIMGAWNLESDFASAIGVGGAA